MPIRTLLFAFALTMSCKGDCLTRPDPLVCPAAATSGDEKMQHVPPAAAVPPPEWRMPSNAAPQKNPSWTSPFRIGEMMALGGIAADVASSWGCLESNPLLRSPDGRFGTKGMLIKVSLSGGAVVLSHYLYRKHPKLGRPLGIVLGVTGGALQGVALRNRAVGCI